MRGISFYPAHAYPIRPHIKHDIPVHWVGARVCRVLCMEFNRISFVQMQLDPLRISNGMAYGAGGARFEWASRRCTNGSSSKRTHAYAHRIIRNTKTDCYPSVLFGIQCNPIDCSVVGKLGFLAFFIQALAFKQTMIV